MNLRNLWIAGVALSVLAVVAFALAVGSTADRQGEVMAIARDRRGDLELAAHLLQSSEDLTRMARNFAVTGDSRYEDIYRRIVAVREGKAPRPPGDSPAYWDLLLANAPVPKGEGERLSLAEELNRAKLPAAEQALASRAASAQEALAKLEERALGAMKGLSSAAGGAAAAPQSDPVLALKILYGDEYLEAKARCLQALSELQTAIELRTRGDLAFKHQGLARALQTEWLVLVAFAIFGAGILVFALWRAVLPMRVLRRQAAALLGGNYTRQIETRALPDIVELTRALNEAASRLAAGTAELAERERYVEALLRTSPLGLALVDAKNRVRWTSRRLREFLGDAKQDLKQLPFDEFFADPAELAAFRDMMDRKGRVRELLARIRRRDGTEFRARLDSAYVEVSAERMAAVWVQAFGLHGQTPGAAAPEDNG